MRYNNYHKHDHISNVFTPDVNVKVEDYLKKCVEYGHTNYFTTNHGSFGDIFESRTLCDQYGIRCIAGIEGYIVPNPLEKDKSNYHIIVIPKTDAARKKMNYVSSHANIEGYYFKPRFFLEDLLALDPNDVFITTACVAGLLKDEIAYKEIFKPLAKHFGENMMLEVQSHDHPIQVAVNERALKLHKAMGLRLIAANDSHYIGEEDKNERMEFLKGKHITYNDEDSFILDFPTDEVMFERFQKQGVLSEDQIEDAIKNTLLFDDCEEIQLDKSIKMPTIYPDLTPDERVAELKKIINKKFKEICHEEHITGEEYQRYKEGIRYEMDIIEKTNEVAHTADYFLFNTKNVDLAVNKYGGVLTRGGRGSCASFYINRILGMTQLDRFQIHLPIFPDRFMSVARCIENRSMPDIDFNIKEQEPFVAASKELLGEEGCYPMYAPGCMQLSEAFRNVCRSKGLDYDKYNEVAKDVESYIDDPDWKDVIAEANRYVGTIVSASVHPCAHLLSDKDIRYEYGVYRFGDHLCVMITSSEADEYKVLKNDYLIVSVWKLIDETFKKVGIPIIPANQLLNEIKNDQRIWDLFKNGITCTLNQVDSDNGTRQAKEYGISSFEEGALITAAIRPSFDSWREQFLKHKEYSTGSDKLDAVLDMTGHYILYQENLMQYFDWLGVTPSESIGLIKKISKKKIKESDFANLEDRLRQNWIEKTGSEAMFDETWQMIQSCMAYGFCSAHAAATSLDMCYGAYLKVHYPYEYYTVCLDHYSGDEERTKKLTKELEYFGIKIGNIKFGFSRAYHSFNKDEHIIYKGLTAIKYLSEKVAEELYSLRNNKYNTFTDLLYDITDKTSCDSRQLDILVKLNFFEEFGDINDLLAQIENYRKLRDKKTLKVENLSTFRLTIDQVKPFAEKITEKQIKISDMRPLITDMNARENRHETSLIDRVRYENELLGYISLTLPDIAEHYYYITKITGNASRMVSLYQLKTGKTEKYKVRKAYFEKNPLEEGQIINVIEITEDYKWRCTNSATTGKKEFERTDEREFLLTRYKILKKSKKSVDKD